VGGCLHLGGKALAVLLYREEAAGIMLRYYGLLAPMLYCDALVDAMTKGLGQQRICVKYNIITSAMDVAGLFILLPRLGMKGYFISFLITHLINFLLSLRRLIKISKVRISSAGVFKCILAALSALGVSYGISSPLVRIMAYIALFFAQLLLLGVLHGNDLHWLCGLFFFHQQDSEKAAS